MIAESKENLDDLLAKALDGTNSRITKVKETPKFTEYLTSTPIGNDREAIREVKLSDDRVFYHFKITSPESNSDDTVTKFKDKNKDVFVAKLKEFFSDLSEWRITSHLRTELCWLACLRAFNIRKVFETRASLANEIFKYQFNIDHIAEGYFELWWQGYFYTIRMVDFSTLKITEWDQRRISQKFDEALKEYTFSVAKYKNYDELKNLLIEVFYDFQESVLAKHRNDRVRRPECCMAKNMFNRLIEVLKP